MMLSTIVIDDEPAAVDLIKEMIGCTTGLVFEKGFGSATEAIAYLRENGPVDVIFCDIKMPHITGIEAGKILNGYCRHLIYVTAYREFGAEASELNASGYLVKPVSKSMFMEKIEHLFIEEKRFEGKPIYNHIFLKGDDKNHFWHVCVDDIVWMEANENYTKVKLAGREDQILTKMSLITAENKLAKYGEFIRINKSLLVSIRYITHVKGLKITFRITENNVPAVRTAGRKFRDDFFLLLKSRGFNT